jgi:uncharacterized protein (TIGR02453 family)
MSNFKKSYLDFFASLEKHNTKEWFDANRSVYESEVKEPFTAFVGELIELIQNEDSEVRIASKEAIFRINRDTRFSKDKRPYKTYMAANISRYGRKNKEYPGFYVQLGYDKIMVGGGAHTLEDKNIYNVRKAIVKDQRMFESLLADKQFKKRYGSLQGERSKILLPEFKAIAASQPTVANKQFYFMSDLEAQVILRKDLAAFLMQYYRAGAGISQFLKKAMAEK